MAARKTGQKRTIKGTRAVSKKAPEILKDNAKSGVVDSDGRFKMILDAAGEAVVVFDSDGKTYEITNTLTGKYEYKLASLNMGGFFVPLSISTDNGFDRFFNSNISPKYIIDNVYTEAGAINYTESPLNIYGIGPKNFTRIEYTNVVYNIGLNRYNPFTVYSSGEIAGSDDEKSIAIVRDASHNSFRIGNLDDAENLRNVNLIFDVSSLIHTKQPGNYFNENTPPGSVLTNYEINANSLFDPNFNGNPDSFVGNMVSTTATVSWNLLHFTGDPLVSGDLYFYERLNPGTFRIDSSAARPLIFSNIAASGTVNITGLSSTKVYETYIKLNKNGWTRNSDIKAVFNGILVVTPASLSGEPSAGYSFTNKFNVHANATWDVSFGDATWITNPTLSGNNDGSIGFALPEKIGSSRNAVMVVTLLGGLSQSVAISQKGNLVPTIFNYAKGTSYQTPPGLIAPYAVSYDSSCQSSITATGLPGDTVFDVSLYFTLNYFNFNTIPNDVQYVSQVRIWKNGVPVSGPPSALKSFSETVIQNSPTGDAGTIALTNLMATDFPLTVLMVMGADTVTSPPAIPPEYYYFESNFACSAMQAFHKSGTGISDEYTNFGSGTTLWATNSFA